MVRRCSLALTFAISLALIVGTCGVASAHEKSQHETAKSKVKVEVFGDSTALTLAWSLAAKSLGSKYGYTLENSGGIGCGLVEGPAVRFKGKVFPTQSSCNGTTPPPGTPLKSQPWPVQWQADMAKFHPDVVVILSGRWEIADRVYNGQWTNILDPTFASYVKQQLEMASNLVTATGANVVFLTSPCTDEATQPDGAPWPESDPNRLATYNELVRQVAAEYPTTDSVVDLNAVACPKGKYTSMYKGIRIRTPEGIHFTEQAGLVLGPLLMPPIVTSGRAQLARVGKLQAAKRSG